MKSSCVNLLLKRFSKAKVMKELKWVMLVVSESHRGDQGCNAMMFVHSFQFYPKGYYSQLSEEEMWVCKEEEKDKSEVWDKLITLTVQG